MVLSYVQICTTVYAKDIEERGGLVHPNGSKYWRLRYRFGCKEKMLALGKYPEVSLVDARTRRDETRKLLANGIDLSENKKVVKVEQEQEAITFE